MTPTATTQPGTLPLDVPVTRERPAGFVHWVFPAMLALAAISVLVSGRDLAEQYKELESTAEVIRSPFMTVAQRAVSVLLLLASAERLYRHLVTGAALPSPVMAVAFGLYWITTVALPAFYGTNKMLAHEVLYPLILGSAVLVLTPGESRRVIDAARTGLLLFLLVSVAMIPIDINMVLDLTYAQGYIPGLPRLGGVAAHPVSLGMLALVALMCLWCRPFQRRWLNRLAWILGLGVLFMTQSKTAWVAFSICVFAVAVMRNGGRLWQRATDPRNSLFGVAASAAAILVLVAITAVLLGTDVVGTVQAFFDSPEGAQLASLTGRNRIWAIAMEEWQASPFFGYGLSLWDAGFRASINMPNATHAHNQFIDTLARSGAIGAAGLVIYATVLLFMSLSRATTTGGLTVALFFSLALLSVSEVPLLLLGYGTDLFTHLLLIAALVSAAAPRRRPYPAVSPVGYRTS